MDLEDAAAEYLSWLQVEANYSPAIVRAYTEELRRFTEFLEETGHSLQLDALRQEDLRAFQLHLAILPGRKGPRLSPGSRARALVAIRAWLRWLAKEGLVQRDLWSRITVPKQPERLPKPYELPRLLAGPIDKRDRALVHFLISTGCRISEAPARA